jgi:hypothetical protein
MDNDRLDIDRVVFVGRTLAEYKEFLDLDIDSLKGLKVLDCPSGPSSFVAEANRIGIRAVGCDAFYDLLPLEQLVKKGLKDISHVMERLSEKMHLFKWDYYSSVEDVKESRTRALKIFEEDFQIGLKEERYIKASLPFLPFPDRSFELVVSAHFLFIYDDKLDYEFHLNSILELTRVCSEEVRIYPLQSMNARTYPFMEKLINDLKQEGAEARIVEVGFEFLRGSTFMLQIKHTNL